MFLGVISVSCNSHHPSRCVRLQGGLGNQIFQYAYAVFLKKKLGSPVFLDSSYLGCFDPPRRFQLSEIFYDAASWLLPSYGDLDASLLTHVAARWVKSPRLAKLLGGVNVELEGATDPALNVDHHCIYWIGYWQSFLIANMVREDLLRSVSPLSADAFDLASSFCDLSAENLVAMHIRRGDYVSNPRANQHHGVTPLTYFEGARDYLRGRVGPLSILIFSDDMVWARENIVSRGDELIYVEGLADFDELKLMALCRHHVISNSSFSWWGAFMKSSNFGIKIAPKQWYANPSMQGPNLFDDTWVRM